PSVEELKKRLTLRSTDSDEDIQTRIDKAEEELRYADKFDVVIVNDILEKAIQETEQIVLDFIKK
ncbi:MAG TPA: guanylate kinase, partial [Bacteroidales bacterium]|nr:guanylate kinase [Bacteroidales bacterium]